MKKLLLITFITSLFGLSAMSGETDKKADAGSNHCDDERVATKASTAPETETPKKNVNKATSESELPDS